MVICPDCGTEVPDAKFCKNCGRIAIVPYATPKSIVKIIVPNVKFQFLKMLKSKRGFLHFNSHQTKEINAIKLEINDKKIM